MLKLVIMYTRKVNELDRCMEHMEQQTDEHSKAESQRSMAHRFTN